MELNKTNIALGIPIIQIVYPANKLSMRTYKIIDNSIETESESKDNSRHSFTITLNLDTEFKIRRSLRRRTRKEF